MDSLHPPPRLLPSHPPSPLSPKNVKKRIDAFLADFTERCTPGPGNSVGAGGGGGGDASVVARLRGVSKALGREEKGNSKREVRGV